MLGAVSEHSAAIWVRTTFPCDITFELSELGVQNDPRVKKLKTTAASDNTCIVRFNGLKHDTTYRYAVVVGDTKYRYGFTTFGPAASNRNIRIVYGYGYYPREDAMPEGTSIFVDMAPRKADVLLFLGDFPYTSRGRRHEIHSGHKKLRSIIGFRDLTASTPSYGIYDDQDFGPNDCDGTHENADEALFAFKEYWPNPSYGQAGDAGIYSSFVVGNVEVFLLDGRYPSRQIQGNSTMLGKPQFRWLCQRLKQSKARYKVLVSGTPFTRVKRDCWGGSFFLPERNRLFAFIRDNKIAGVIGISGDIHRCDIHKIPLGEDWAFYDFTAGSLSRVHRPPPKKKPKGMVYSYGFPERNMFAEIDFHTASDTNTSLVFRSFSGKNGLVYEHRLSPRDLGLKSGPGVVRPGAQPSTEGDGPKPAP
jgi:alkaline phosphatase D